MASATCPNVAASRRSRVPFSCAWPLATNSATETSRRSAVRLRVPRPTRVRTADKKWAVSAPGWLAAK
eukprot:2588602-Lingulodinium_polyedra.AAC.1